MKLHPNTERCVRLDVARQLVVMNLEEPLPATIAVRGTGEVISVRYPWLPPRCHGCQKWGHTDKSCPKNKKSKEKLGEEVEQQANAEGGTEAFIPQEGSIAGEQHVNTNSKTIDIEQPVLEAANLASDEVTAQDSKTQSSGEEENVPIKAINTTELVNNESWLTVPHGKSPTGRRNHGKSDRIKEVAPPSTSSPSRFHLLSDDLEESEVGSDSSDEESSAESQIVLERKKQVEQQKSGKTKKSQKGNPSVNAGGKKDQAKGAKNNKANNASSRRH